MGPQSRPLMPIELTNFAQRAITEMSNAATVAFNVQWDIQICDSDFINEVNPNEGYNAIATQHLESSAISRIVDAYQWYNGQIFLLFLKHDRSAYEKIREGVTLTSGDLRRISSGEDALAIAVERIRFKDAAVRNHLHTVLGLWEETEMELMVEMRNCFAHHLGQDHRGKVAAWLKANGGGWKLGNYVSVVDGQIIIKEGAAHICQSVGLSQISIFDQVAAKTFALPTSPSPPTKGPSRHRKGK
jgi:hypothetical protein